MRRLSWMIQAGLYLMTSILTRQTQEREDVHRDDNVTTLQKDGHKPRNATAPEAGGLAHCLEPPEN